MKHSDICKHCLEAWGEHESLKSYCPQYDDTGKLHGFDITQKFERLNIHELVAKVEEQGKEIERLKDDVIAWEESYQSVKSRLISQISEQSQRIAALKAEREWIKCSEMLPKDYQRVMYFDSRKQGFIEIGYFVSTQTPVPKYVTHWQPLPSPPKQN